MAPKSTTKKPSSSSKASDSGEEKKKTKKSTVKITDFIVRPHNFEQLSDVRNSAYIYLSENVLNELELKPNSFVNVINGLEFLTLMVNVNEQADDAVMINPIYLQLTGWLLGDRVQLQKDAKQAPYAEFVEVISQKNEKEMSDILSDVGIVYQGLRGDGWYIKSFSSPDIETNLAKLSLENMNSELKSYIFHPKSTKITIINDTPPEYKPKFSLSQIGALQTQISTITKTMYLPLSTPEMFSQFGISPPRGILIHGNSGTGKSMILRSIPYEFNKAHIVRITSDIIGRYLGETEERLRSLWQEAVKYQPSIIIFDEIDTLVPNRSAARDEVSDADGRVLTTLLNLMDSTDPKAKLVVIGATTRVTNIDLSLRRPGRFDIEVDIPVPDADGRIDILDKLLCKMEIGKHLITNDQKAEIGGKTHGYVGSDLVALVREAVMHTIEESLEFSTEPVVTFPKFELALTEIKPSAMKEIVLEMPKIKWSDIGGQTILKRKLKEMVQLPLLAAPTFHKLGIKAPKGLLLYGPPGCSKTMTAKALASESGLNFLAIKGPEMFDKYVGESERKIREIFNKARQSAPSIVFIDEIDAIALDRESGEGSHVGKQVLNTMLNEIDGVEELKGVVVIGATNRPDAIDPALLRPGRLDRHVYVSPPDADARREIFVKNTCKFNLSEGEELLDELVKWSEGFSGSECVLLCQEAGLNAIMASSDPAHVELVKKVDFEKALGEISKNITPEMLAYFEDFGKKYSA